MDAREAALDMPPDGLDANEARRVARLHALIQEGLDELDRGEGAGVTDVKAWLDSLGRRSVAGGHRRIK